MIKFCWPNAVEQELLADMTNYDTVNNIRLKMYTADWASEKPPPPQGQTVQDTDGTIQHAYVVEAFTLHKRALAVNGGYRYQIKWEGDNNDEVTWEPAANLWKPKQILFDYKKQHRLGETKVKRKH